MKPASRPVSRIYKYRTEYIYKMSSRVISFCDNHVNLTSFLSKCERNARYYLVLLLSSAITGQRTKKTARCEYSKTLFSSYRLESFPFQLAASSLRAILNVIIRHRRKISHDLLFFNNIIVNVHRTVKSGRVQLPFPEKTNYQTRSNSIMMILAH